MKNAIVSDDSANEEVCKIEMKKLPKTGDSVMVIKDDNSIHYFRVERIHRKNGVVNVVLCPIRSVWAAGYVRKFGATFHCFVANSEYVGEDLFDINVELRA